MSNQYNLRSGLVLYPAQQDDIEQILNTLTNQLPIQVLLLVDVTGQVISSRGEQGHSNAIALGSLIAGDLAASQEIARLTGQYHKSQMVIREGESTHTFIGEAGQYLAMMVQVSSDTPLGWARAVIQKTAQKLTKIALQAQNQKTEETEKLLVIPEEEEKLTDLFNDALDDLWSDE